jgi:starch synthase
LLVGANPALRILAADLSMAERTGDCDLVHSHTWYANMGGHLSKLLHDIPHVVTSHSLEPQRPWKAEQLGGGYRVSSWAERTAYEAADAVIAVSEGSRRDVLSAYPDLDESKVHVVHNGIDSEFYRPDTSRDVMDRLGVDPSRPSAVFVGRITRQKGVPHLLRAALHFDESVQLVLLAGAADTPELKAETDDAIEALRASRDGVHVVSEMLPREEVRQVLTHGTVFVCPSVYEPLGIVNLEAMACETAVVATATGGIVEVVADGETGYLVPLEERDDGTHEPRDPDVFAAAIAERVGRLVADPARAAAMGRAGRAAVIERFAWPAIAERTAALYRRVAG